MRIPLLAAAVMLAALAVPAAFSSSSNTSSNSSSSSSDSPANFSRRSRSSSSNSNSSSQANTGSGQSDITNKRTSDRKSSTRDRNSNAKGNTQGAGAKKTDAKSVKGKQPPAKKTASKGGAAQGSTSVEFKMKANPLSNLLMVESVAAAPTMNILVRQGDIFATRVIFRDGRQEPFDTMDIAIKYDPSIVRPIGLDDSELQPLLDGSAMARTDPKRGIVAYHARLAKPSANEMVNLFKVAWEALAPTDRSTIAFLNDGDFPTRVLGKDRDLLQPVEDDAAVETLDFSENAGLVGADLSVVAADRGEGGDESATPMAGAALAHEISQGTAEGGITVALRPGKTAVAVGEEFDVSIDYTNPKMVEVDMFRLRIRFDPQVLQVVDSDEDNNITKGVNIHDGKSRDALPFDFHIRNAVYNKTGEIDYENGFRQRTVPPGRGTVATIRFKAVAPVESTDIRFDFSENEKKTATSVSFLGFNLIGKPGAREAALANTAVSVR